MTRELKWLKTKFIDESSVFKLNTYKLKPNSYPILVIALIQIEPRFIHVLLIYSSVTCPPALVLVHLRTPYWKRYHSDTICNISCHDDQVTSTYFESLSKF